MVGTLGMCCMLSILYINMCRKHLCVFSVSSWPHLDAQSSYFLNRIDSVERFVGSWMLILRNDLAGASSGFFNLPWTEYQQGFGSPTTLYWIGLDRLHQLTQGNCQARFDLQFEDETWHYVQYSRFSVGDSSTNYTLTIGGYSGDAGYDAMAASNGRQFTTYDADNDGYEGKNWASAFGGGFWFDIPPRAFITTSTNRFVFMWFTSNGWMHLNVVEISLLC